jgi:hypothetical protein
VLPQWVLQQQGLVGWQEALRGLHAPATVEQHERAVQRLAFQEAFLLQVGSRGAGSAGAAAPCTSCVRRSRRAGVEGLGADGAGMRVLQGPSPVWLLWGGRGLSRLAGSARGLACAIAALVAPLAATGGPGPWPVA